MRFSTLAFFRNKSKCNQWINNKTDITNQYGKKLPLRKVYVCAFVRRSRAKFQCKWIENEISPNWGIFWHLGVNVLCFMLYKKPHKQHCIYRKFTMFWKLKNFVIIKNIYLTMMQTILITEYNYITYHLIFILRLF